MSENECAIDWCDRPRKTRGMCGMHAERQRAGLDMNTPPRIYNQPFANYYQETPGGCWEWLAGRTDNGYGRYQRQYAHRASYEMHKGPIPDGLQIDHLCRNRACVNPDHLEAIPQRLNVLRGMSPSAIAARTNRCYAGHDLTVHGYVRPDGNGRQCNECRRERRARGAA